VSAPLHYAVLTGGQQYALLVRAIHVRLLSALMRGQTCMANAKKYRSHCAKMNLLSCRLFSQWKSQRSALLFIMSRSITSSHNGIFRKSSSWLLLLTSCGMSVMFGCGSSDSSGGTSGVGGGNEAGGATSATGGSSAANPGGGAPTSGGSPATGGSHTGATTGPALTGGSPGAGGAATGGTNSNHPTGGKAAGGANVGGAQTGGQTAAPAGGKAAGGNSSPGGAATGGGSTSTGGKAAGGGGTPAATGGKAAGGVTATGGSSTTDGGAYVGTKTPGTAQTGDITVDPTKLHQVVDGFGEADTWQGSSSTQMQTLLWDPVNGIGLNLLRMGIESTSGKSVLMGNAGIADGKACKQFSGDDCKIWAAPWSPPAAMKNNNNVNGNSTNACSASANSRLKTDSYDAWATLLAAFPAYYKQQSGLDVYAISAQNEPDWNPNYEACCYTGPEMVNFIKVLGPKLATLSPPVKLLAAEPDNWSNFWGGDNYATDILADATASAQVTILATHDYGNTSAGTWARPAPPAGNTHHIWETECTPSDTGPITIATMVYAAFNTGGVNGWHYWWTQAFIPNASSPPPQYYALGNFSKFVRPGYYRVDVSGAPAASNSNPAVIAFSSLKDGTTTIVVVNAANATKSLNFFVGGTTWPASVTPYETTTSSKLAAGTPITLAAGRFAATVAAQSVTTFTGKP
jgi:glucuronoarabinoxylan endo-1,4-beta-xylanase